MLVVVRTAAGEVLLLKRVDHPDFWQSVTGGLRAGEMPAQAARRELEEETGIAAGERLRDLRHTVSFEILPQWRARYAPGVTRNREHWFSVSLPQRCGIRLNPAEHLAYAWLDAEAAAARVWSWSNRDAIACTATR